MRTLALSTLRTFWEGGHASAEAPLRDWYIKTERMQWSGFGELRSTFASADQVGNKVVFNIGGNNFRLIAAVNYPFGRVLVRWIGTHAEYDRLTKKEIERL